MIYVAYAYHTWMESCACQLNFDTKMSGLAYIPREQGILLTVEKNPGPQPDTASHQFLSKIIFTLYMEHGILNEASIGIPLEVWDAGAPTYFNSKTGH